MKVDKINEWLNSEREYQDGVKLYQTAGKNSRLKTFFLTKDNDFAKEKLAYELGKLIDVEVVLSTSVEEKPTSVVEAINPLPTVPIAPIDAPKVSTPILTHLINQDYPEELASMVLERAALTNKKGILSNSLDTFAADDNEGRKGVMAEMKGIRERINVINDVERHWQRTKTILKPTDEPVKSDKLTAAIPTSPIELIREKKALTEARSKAKKLLEKVGETSPKGQELQIKIIKINERYEAIEKALA